MTQLAFRTAGSSDVGRAAVFVAGLTETHEVWHPVLQGMPTGVVAVSFDNRGVGQSPQLSRPWSMSDFARDTLSLLDYLELADADLVGSSMGGAIALQLAISYPSRVRSLTLVSTFARPDPLLRFVLHSWKVLAEQAPISTLVRSTYAWGFARSYYNAISRSIVDELDLTTTTDSESFIASCEAMLAFDAKPGLASVRCPTLVISGSDDILTPTELGREIADGVQGARFEILQGIGHAIPTEAPHTLATLLAGFWLGVHLPRR